MDVRHLATLSNPQLRKTLRRHRLTLSRQQRHLAAQQAARQLDKLPRQFIQPMSKIAVFVDAFGEMPTQPLLNWAARNHLSVYLPVVNRLHNPLTFVQLSATTIQKARLAKHPLGMRQPANGHQLQAHELDIIFMPLVAFDNCGYRMGMGGGFYDRTLAKTKTKPLKVGWAYNFQQVEQLSHEPWDVRLDMAIVPSGLKIFRRYLNQSN